MTFLDYELFFLSAFAVGFVGCIAGLVAQIAGPRPEDDR